MSVFHYGDIKSDTVKLDEKMVENDIQIKVSKNCVWDCKNNEACKIVSFHDVNSENGYGNLVLDVSAINSVSDDFYIVHLNSKSNYGYSIKQDDHYVIKKLSGNQLQDIANQSYPESVVYLNGISKKLIHDGKNPDYKIVSVPFPESENGFANITVPSKVVFSMIDCNTKQIVTDKMNIRLGTSFQSINFTIKKDNQYIRKTMQASQFVKKINDYRHFQAVEFQRTVEMPSDFSDDEEQVFL